MLGNLGPADENLQQGEVVATALPHPKLVMTTKLTVVNMLGITDDGHIGPEIPSVAHHLSPLERREKVEMELEHFDLQHVPREYRQSLRSLLKRYLDIFDGTLGEINVAESHIQLTPDAKLQLSHPYRERPVTRMIDQVEIEKTVRAGLIEPAKVGRGTAGRSSSRA